MISAIDSLIASSLMEGHQPVLADEALEMLVPRDGGLYIDCTFGGGGHSSLILEAADARVIALDTDPAAARRADELSQRYGDRFRFEQMNFSRLSQLELEPVDGVLFDFGVSSFQLDDVERGFSFRGDAPLDMRMNPEQGVSAAEWLASASRSELIRSVRDWGEESNWRRIVDAIVAFREKQPIATTEDLANIILSCTPARLRYGSKRHPATKVFQGIRIAVNDELAVIETALPVAFDLLKPGGTLCAISFHSLEDRIAKRLFRYWAGRPEGKHDHRPQDMREVRAELLARGHVSPSAREVASNARSRSAKLRAVRKVMEAIS